MTGLTISTIVLWALQIATVVVVVGLARQIGVLHLRVRPIGPGQRADGPEVGSRATLPSLTSLRGHRVPVVGSGEISLIAFANPTCTACGPTMKAVKRLSSVESGLRLIVAVDGDPDQALSYAATYGITDVVDPTQLKAFDSSARPFVTAMSDEGIILATGVPNTLEQLESLTAAARHRRSFIPQDGEPTTSNSTTSEELKLIDISSTMADEEPEHGHSARR